MKANLFLLVSLLSILPVSIYAQNSEYYARTQIIEFSNLKSGNNYHSGEIYCFDETKVTFQLRTSSLNGKFHGTIIFIIGQESYSINDQTDDFFKEITLCLPKGQTTASISLLPDIGNNYRGDAYINIIATGKGTVGIKNIISSLDR